MRDAGYEWRLTGIQALLVEVVALWLLRFPVVSWHVLLTRDPLCKWRQGSSNI